MKKSVLLLALCMYIFAGCNKEPQNTTDQEECQVEVSFTNDFSKSLLKSTTTAEKGMTEVILFGVDASGNYVGKYAIPAPIEGVNSVNILKRNHTLYAIANPSPAIKALENQNKAALDALVGDFATAPVTPLLMGGSGVIAVNSGVYTVNIALIRSMAKVVFTSTDAALTITGVKAMNTPNQGFVFKQTLVAVPASAARISTYTAVAGTDAAPVYVAENTNTSDAIATKFIVTGVYNSKTANYEVILKTGSTLLPIERNKQYNVSISPSDETSCGITISMPDWDDEDAGNYVIPDDQFH
jgi:ABC-type uncharacterized transport system auxiliary subunit